MKCLSCLSISGKKRISPGPIIYEGSYWIVDHAYPTNLLGWLVIILKRHAEALHDVHNEEFEELGKLQEKTTKFLRDTLSCEKEYFACFSEGKEFQHIHFHVIPKTKAITEDLKGPKVFAMLKVGEKESVEKNEIIKLSKILKKKFK